MHLRQKLRFGFGWRTTICILVFAWTMNAVGLFTAIDQTFHDCCQRISAKPYNDSGVLLVHAPDSYFQNDRKNLLLLLKQLNSCDPKVIGIVNAGDTYSQNVEDASAQNRQFLNELQQQPFAGKLVIGCTADSQSQVSLQQSKPIKSGFVDLDLLHQSIYRQSQAKILADGKSIYSFEAQMARAMLPSDKLIPIGKFGIRFGSANRGLPQVKVDELMSGNLVSELVTGKAVLIARQQRSTFGVFTPLSAATFTNQATSTQRMSRLELRGNIVETLLRQNQIQKSSWIFNLILLTLLSVLFCQLARQTSRERWLSVFAGSTLLGVLLAIGSFFFTATTLPVTAMVAICLLAFGTVLFQRFGKQFQSLHHLNLMIGVKERGAKEISDETTWSQVADAAYQLFYPKRMILFKLDDGATHLEVIQMVNCDQQHLHEQRRDIQRSPFREAFENSEPMRNHGYNFFKPGLDANGVEYAVPLMAVSKPIGMIFIELESAHAENWTDLPNFLQQFAEDMSMFVANRRIKLQKHHQQSNWLSRLRTTPEQGAYDQLQKLKTIENDLFQSVQNAFRRTESPAAVYDAFGNMLQCNDNFMYLLQKQHVSADISCVELLSAISNESQFECRALLRQSLHGGKSVDIHLSPDGQHKFARRLLLKPVSLDSDSQGVVVEVCNNQDFSEIDVCRSQINQALIVKTKRRIDLLQVQLGNLSSAETASSQELQALNDTVQSTANLVGSLMKEAGCPDDRPQASEFNIGAVLDAALDRVKRKAAMPVTFDCNIDSQASVLAKSLPELLELLETVCQSIVASAADEQLEIQINCEQAAGVTALQFQNEQVWLEPATKDDLNRFNESLQSWDARLKIDESGHNGTVIEIVFNGLSSSFTNEESDSHLRRGAVNDV